MPEFLDEGGIVAAFLFLFLPGLVYHMEIDVEKRICTKLLLFLDFILTLSSESYISLLSKALKIFRNNF